MKPLLSMQFALKKELLTTARLTSGGLCALAGLDLDASEDFKVCVTESLLLVLHRGYEEARVSFFLENGLKVFIEGAGEQTNQTQSAEEEISVALLQALVDNLEMKKENGTFSVAFSFGIK